jgi:hypothetical protein
MKTELKLKLDLPDNIKLTARDAAMIIAGKLYSERLLSAGKAASLVGISKREFLESLGQYGYSFLNLTAEEIRQELES